MNILAIDTSSTKLSLAVSKDEQVLGVKNLNSNKVLSSKIFPSIDKLLERVEIPLSKIDGFVVGLGPGSFMGLRVGLSTIKGLVFAPLKPVVGISSLDAIAMGVPNDGKICCFSDARRGLVYNSFYEKKNGVLKIKKKCSLDEPKNVIKNIDQETRIVGDAVTLYSDLLKKFKSENKIDSEKYIFPQAKNLIHLSLERFSKKKTDNVSKLVPMYLYPEDCQVNR